MKRPRLTKKKIILIIVNAVLLLGSAALMFAYSFTARELLSQQAAERWRGQSDQRFAQISCFFSEKNGLSEANIYDFRNALEGQLQTASLSAPEEGALYADAWSSISQLEASGNYGSSTAIALAIGGDFFLFHPYVLRSGSYFSPDDLMNDRVVIDEELAWKLFGALDVAGMDVVIKGRPFRVAGVIAREKDRFSRMAITSMTDNQPLIFLSASALNELSDTGEKSSLPITCYELVCADPVTGFASNMAEDDLMKSHPGELIENSGRFAPDTIFSLISEFQQRMMVSNTIVYPYWENAARLMESRLAVILIAIVGLLICPFICLFIYIIRACRALSRRIRRWRDHLTGKDLEDAYTE